MKTLAKQFPVAMGAMTGRGPQVAAAVADAYLCSWKHAASLDYKQCFECLDLQLVRQTLCQGLRQYRAWAATIT